MKNSFKLYITLIVLSIVFSVSTVSFSQPPPPPPPTLGHGYSGDAPAGGGAPIGEGMFLLIGLAGIYGGRKVYDFRKALKNKEA